MFKNLFKTKKQKEQERNIEKQKALIKMAEENGIYVPPSFRPSEVTYGSKYSIAMRPGWYTSLELRAELAERELKRKGLI